MKDMTYTIIPTVKQLIAFAAISLMAASSSAELVNMDDSALAQANGQSGVLIDTEVQLNRSQNGDGSIGNAIDCAKGGTDCEYALRFDGNDKWLVIYDLSGGIDIKNLKVSAATVDDGSANGRPALAIGDTTGAITATAKFDNFGGSSWAFTGDDGVTPGYRASVLLGADGSLDERKPKGFWDLRIHGTLSMTGGLKIFNCAGMTGC